MGRGREPISDLAIAVGARLRAVRRAAGCSQAHLAEAIHVTQGSVSNYEAGLRDIPVHLLLAALDTLQYEPAHFFEGIPGLLSARDDSLRAAVFEVRDRCWPSAN